MRGCAHIFGRNKRGKDMRPVKYYAPFEAEGIYHVFNRANSNKDLLFVEERNYHFFLHKYQEYLHPFAETYAFCLIPNHFHLLIEVRPEKKIRSYLEVEKKWKGMESAPVDTVLIEAFRRFFISYSKSFNKVDSRRGALFKREFRRVRIESSYHFFTEVFYIHNNPIKHGLVSSIEEYPWSSYIPLLYGIDDHTDWLKRDKIIEWFEGEENFELFHRGRD
jgi:putative transposase